MPARAVAVLAATALTGIGAGTAAADRGPAALADACATCHGPEGRSEGAIPSIAGMPAAEFVSAMQAFREGAGEPTLMDEIANGLSETEIEALAAWFEAHP